MNSSPGGTVRQCLTDFPAHGRMVWVVVSLHVDFKRLKARRRRSRAELSTYKSEEACSCLCSIYPQEGKAKGDERTKDELLKFAEIPNEDEAGSFFPFFPRM